MSIKKAKPNIYFADDIHAEGKRLLKKRYNLVESALDNTTLLKFLALNKSSSQNDALVIRSVRKVDSSFIRFLKQHTGIKLICTVSSGFDNIDIKACNESGVKFLNVYGGNVVSAAEHTFALILASFKNLVNLNAKMKKGQFNNTGTINTEILGKTIGIIGVGRIGSKVAAYSRSFGMKILGNDINPKLKVKKKWITFVPVNRLLKSSDIITVHTPLDDSTYHLINKSNIPLIKEGAVLINCARGGIVDEKYLLKALQTGKIRYAGLDVFENEPGFNKQLTKPGNIILTPHTAGKTAESKKRMSIMAAKAILRHYNKR